MLVLVLVGVVLTWSIRSSNRADAEVARLEAAGEPTTPQDLEAMYDRPPADPEVAKLWLTAIEPLSGDAYRAAGAELPIVGAGESEIPPPGQPWESLEAAEKLLAEYESCLREMNQAAGRGGVGRYPTDFALGFAMQMEHFSMLRPAARLLALKAHVCAHRGDAAGCARAIHAIFRLAGSLQREPMMISQLVRISLDHVAADLLRKLLPHVDFSDEDLQLLRADLRQPDYREAVRLALTGERVLGIQAIRNPASMDDPDDNSARLFMMRGDDLSFYLQHMGRTIAALEKPWPQARRETAEAHQELSSKAHQGSLLDKFRYGLTGMVAPAFEALLQAAARAQTIAALAETAIAVEQHRRRHGKLPQQLDELVPELLPSLPLDSYHGQPLRYVARENEYVIYSVGEDGVDDGGFGNDNGKPDRVFPVEIPPGEK